MNKIKFLTGYYIRCFYTKFYKKRQIEEVLTPKAYLLNFGIVKDGTNYIVLDEKKLEKAYLKAWENRNYEIDKFWTRAAYFWGFIVLIFGGYLNIITSENNKKALQLNLDLYFLSLGVIFSVAWYLVMRGSKSWQENWEHHIDRLENFVSGPIYKTVHYSGNRFYSVSKVNEVLSLVVIIVWTVLLLSNLNDKYSFCRNIKSLDISSTLTITILIIALFSLIQGYCLGYYKAKKKGFINRWG